MPQVYTRYSNRTHTMLSATAAWVDTVSFVPDNVRGLGRSVPQQNPKPRLETNEITHLIDFINTSNGASFSHQPTEEVDDDELEAPMDYYDKVMKDCSRIRKGFTGCFKKGSSKELWKELTLDFTGGLGMTAYELFGFRPKEPPDVREPEVGCNAINDVKNSANTLRFGTRQRATSGRDSRYRLRPELAVELERSYRNLALVFDREERKFAAEEASELLIEEIPEYPTPWVLVHLATAGVSEKIVAWRMLTGLLWFREGCPHLLQSIAIKASERHKNRKRTISISPIGPKGATRSVTASHNESAQHFHGRGIIVTGLSLQGAALAGGVSGEVAVRYDPSIDARVALVEQDFDDYSCLNPTELRIFGVELWAAVGIHPVHSRYITRLRQLKLLATASGLHSFLSTLSAGGDDEGTNTVMEAASVIIIETSLHHDLFPCVCKPIDNVSCQYITNTVAQSTRYGSDDVGKCSRYTEDFGDGSEHCVPLSSENFDPNYPLLGRLDRDSDVAAASGGSLSCTKMSPDSELVRVGASYLEGRTPHPVTKTTAATMLNLRSETTLGINTKRHQAVVSAGMQCSNATGCTFEYLEVNENIRRYLEICLNPGETVEFYDVILQVPLLFEGAGATSAMQLASICPGSGAAHQMMRFEEMRLAGIGNLGPCKTAIILAPLLRTLVSDRHMRPFFTERYPTMLDIMKTRNFLTAQRAVNPEIADFVEDVTSLVGLQRPVDDFFKSLSDDLPEEFKEKVAELFPSVMLTKHYRALLGRYAEQSLRRDQAICRIVAAHRHAAKLARKLIRVGFKNLGNIASSHFAEQGDDKFELHSGKRLRR